MTLTEFGAIAEMVGAAAVVASLIYLAVQIRQNTAATRAQIHQARSDQAQDALMFVAGSAEFASLLAKLDVDGAPDPNRLEELSNEERIRFRFYCGAVLQRLENMYYQYQKGFLAPATYCRATKTFGRVIPIWERLGILDVQEGEFRTELDRIKDGGVG